jgi:NAD-dependent SIR2 family protein deacetylase
MSSGDEDSNVECLSCGFEAPQSSDRWGTGDHIVFGDIPECPECGSVTTTALAEQ